jgi:ADP-ribose pyrophosphatase
MSTVMTDPRQKFDGDDADHGLVERRISGEQVYKGALLDVRRDRVRLPDGSETVREYIVHPGAVLVIPVQDDGRIIVERQFRYPHDRTFLEFPAGKIDAGESAMATAKRELVEEVGYDALHWTRLGVVHPAISYSTEAIQIYVARSLTHVGAKLDPGEFLEVMTWTEAELHAAVDEGRLTDAKSIAALALHARWAGAPQRSVAVRIDGLVQGVGYRDWTVRRARAAGVTGWVRNRRDGSVEALLQGPRLRCDAIVQDCVQGPGGARVALLEVTPCPFDAALTGFDQRPSV